MTFPEWWASPAAEGKGGVELAREAYNAGFEAGQAKANPKPVYCKHCPFSRDFHYEQDGKLVTPSCSGYEPDIPDQGEGH